MSFSFFKPSRPKTPQEVVKAVKDSLMALDTKTVVEVKALEKAMEEVEKNLVAVRCMLCGDGEVEPNIDQVSQLVLEVCKEDVLSLVIHKLPNLGWEARKDLVHCWSMLLKQQDLPTKHGTVVAEYLTAHYDEFFDHYEKLLTSPNYVTRRQSLKLLSEFLLEAPNSHIMKRYVLEVRYLKIMMTLLKDSSKNIQISAFHIFKVFVANPNKPREVKVILAKNNEKLVELLDNLTVGKGAEDEQFEEEKELIIKEIKRLSCLANFG